MIMLQSGDQGVGMRVAEAQSHHQHTPPVEPVEIDSLSPLQ